MEKLIIRAAITGRRITRDVAPYVPITPDEIVQSAVECWDAGLLSSISTLVTRKRAWEPKIWILFGR